jgi:ubiquinone/menaquinone biosynthesis C-methylase UbiE
MTDVATIDSTGDSGETPADPAASVYAGHARHGINEVVETYRDQASTLARLDWLNQLFSGRYRRRLYRNATGRVLDVACGIGTNVDYLPEATEYVGVDISEEMLDEARNRTASPGLDPSFRRMDAEDLAFQEDSFDTVISSLSTCTFPDPVTALAEMGRVCSPSGSVLLLEHGRSSLELIGRFQDWRAEAHRAKHSCRWNQEPLAVVGESPLIVTESWTAFGGMITGINAKPP